MAACRAGSPSREVAQPMTAVLNVCVMRLEMVLIIEWRIHKMQEDDSRSES